MKKISKRDLWLQYFIDHTNPRTFLNRSASAKAAGYKAKNDEGFRNIGSQNYTKLYSSISEHLSRVLDKDGVAAKIVQLMDAKKTIFFHHQGNVIEKIKVEDLAIQLSATKLAADIKGMRKHPETPAVKANLGLGPELRETLDSVYRANNSNL